MAENKTTGLRIATIVAALIFFAAGVPKLFAIPEWLFRFYVWGYGKWFLYAVGTLEVLGAAALLYRKTAFAGALVLVAVMVGAFVTHFIHRDGIALLGPVIALALLYPVLSKRRPRNFKWRKRRTSGAD
jgi:uncharacterized membrane protein YphA (DoxX/SURF4 family)